MSKQESERMNKGKRKRERANFDDANVLAIYLRMYVYFIYVKIYIELWRLKWNVIVIDPFAKRSGTS